MRTQADKDQTFSPSPWTLPLLILLLTSILSSCVTINHGYTNKKGSIEIGLDAGYLQNSQSEETRSTYYRPFMKYGVSDDLTMGVNAGIHKANQNAESANGVSFFGLKSFTFDRIDLCLGSGVDYYQYQGNSIVSASASAALSYDYHPIRPFLGLYLAGGVGEAYAGVDLDFFGVRPSILAGVYRTTISSSALGTSNSQAVYFLVPGVSYVF